MDDCGEFMPEGLSLKQDKLQLFACSVAVRDDCDGLIPDDPA